MLRLSTVAIGLSLGLNLLASNARRSGVTRRLRRLRNEPMGARSRGRLHGRAGVVCAGQGAYQLDKAKADAINVETMAKWNKALRARQVALREEKRKEAAKREAAAQTCGSSGWI